MKNIYKDNFDKVEKKIQDLEKELNLSKWAARTGDEPDVVDRASWKKKIKDSQAELRRLGIVRLKTNIT